MRYHQDVPRILIVEDEVHLAQGLLFNLEAEGHTAKAVENGEAALVSLREDVFDVIVLDVMLPGISGFEVAERLRAERNFTPILMLTARSRPEDVLKGFASGADDYLPKPFDLGILLARVGGLLRRTEWSRQAVKPVAAAAPTAAENVAAATAAPRSHEVFEFEGRRLDFDTLELTAPAGKIQLTLMEASLLRYFIAHRNQNVSRKEILEDVWGLKEDTDTRAIDNFIVRLRRYIEDAPGTPKYLITVRGVGYRFLPE
ncbi:MAG: response regulator transcription factor [Acidobacteriota bacterium]|nr:response regulator transcription factor [Acidobacteriota bacterium]